MTIVEVVIASTLAAFILLGVLSSFLFLGRSGANLRNYNDMEAQARKALELFAEDSRQASSAFWTSAESVTLTVNATPIVYARSGQTFTRTVGGVSTTLITGITNFNFAAYTITGVSLALDTATNRTTANGTTKQIQISLSAARTTTTVAAATNIVLSARYIMRNKKVTA